MISAIDHKLTDVRNHYLLGKCYWKMFSCDESIRGNFKRVAIDDVLDSLIDAIEALPQRRDARSDPIFEPHFKLVSIVHKLVHSGTLAVTIDSTFIRSMNFADSSLAC